MAYCSIRARGYMAGVAGVVIRRIHWLVLIVGLCFQMLDFGLIAAPVVGIASNQTGDMAFSLGLLAIGLFLVQIQRDLIQGARFAAYLTILPISTGRQWAADLSVLLLANAVLWVPVVLGILFYLGEAHSQSGELLAGCLTLCSTVLLILQAQLYWLRWNGVAVGLVAFALSAQALLDRILTGTAYLMVMGLVVIITIVLLLRPVAADHRKAWGRPSLRRGVVSRLITAHLPAWLSIQIEALAEKPLGTILSLLSGLLAMAFCLALVFLGQKQALAANIAVMTASVASLFMSKWFYTLGDSHRLSGDYLRALPMSPHYWLMRDWVLVGVLMTILLLPVQLLLLILTTTAMGSLMLTFAVVWSLLLVFRVVIEHLRPQAVLLSGLATALFLYLFGVVFP